MSIFQGLRKKIITFFCLFAACVLAAALPLDVKAEEPAEIILCVEQVFTKNSSLDVNEVFAYQLISLDSSSPMPAGAVNGICSFTLAGTTAVKIPLTFPNAGIFQYQISVAAEYEVNSPVNKVTILVENSDEGLLPQIVVEKSNGEKTGSIRFEHTYTPKASDPEIMVDPPVQKTVSGNPPRAMTFTFTLTAKDPAFPMPEGSIGGVKTITIEGAGQKDFGTWAYIREGIYHYEISEVIRPSSGYTYDKSVYTITDIVKDNDGQLVVTRSVTNEEKKQVGSLIFNNEYRKSVNRGNEANGGSGGKGAVEAAVSEESIENMEDTEESIASVSNIAGVNVPKVGDDGNTEWYTALLFLGVMTASGCIVYLIFTGSRREGS